MCALTNLMLFCTVKVIYHEGSGKNVSHNHTPHSTNILSISRLVVQLYEDLLSPQFAQLEGANQPAPSFVLLHSAHFITSLDPVIPMGMVDPNVSKIEGSFAIAHGLYMVKYPRGLDKGDQRFLFITQGRIFF